MAATKKLADIEGLPSFPSGFPAAIFTAKTGYVLTSYRNILYIGCDSVK